VSKPNDGGPAFPYAFHFPEQDGEPGGIAFGMTLRDYFAGQALPMIAALMAAGKHNAPRGAPQIAQDAYLIAEAMLAEKAARGGAA
jgi:hypothetical protein